MKIIIEEEATRNILEIIENVLLLIAGNKIINFITEQQNKKYFVSQDVLEAKESIKLMLNDIEKNQTQIYVAWSEMEKSMKDVKEFTALEEGVTYVTNWPFSRDSAVLKIQLVT